MKSEADTPMLAVPSGEGIAVTSVEKMPVILVPRITIHAYCDSPQSEDVIRRCGEDRRMYRAHLNVSAGGLSAAIEAYQSRPSPNLIIVQSDLGREEMLSKLSTLAEVCQPDTKVIVIGQVNDVPFYRHLIREGVNEYLVSPIQPLNLIEAIATVYSNPDAPPLGRVVAFMGARGGAGSSTLVRI